MFAIFFLLVLAGIAAWNAEPIFALSERLDLPLFAESAIVLALVGGVPALVVFAGVLLDTLTGERKKGRARAGRSERR